MRRDTLYNCLKYWHTICVNLTQNREDHDDPTTQLAMRARGSEHMHSRSDFPLRGLFFPLSILLSSVVFASEPSRPPSDQQRVHTRDHPSGYDTPQPNNCREPTEPPMPLRMPSALNRHLQSDDLTRRHSLPDLRMVPSLRLFLQHGDIRPRLTSPAPRISFLPEDETD